MPGAAKILVVDDSEANRFALARFLRQFGHEVYEASTGHDCLRLAKESTPALVVLDVKLPDLSGIEVCRRLKSDPATASIPVIQVSAYLTTTHNPIEGLESGADAYLTAPFEPSELLAQVKALLRVGQAEKALRESEQRFRMLFDRNPDALFAVDLLGRFTFANPACTRMSGYTADELLEKNFKDLCAPDQLPATLQAFESGAGSGAAQELETAIIRKDRQRVELLDTSSPIVTNGEVTAIYCAAKDITETKQAARALRESEEKYRILFENMSEGFAIGEAICRPDGTPYDFRFIEINRAFGKQSGLSWEIVGQPMKQVLPNLEQHWIDRYCGVALSGQSIHFEAPNLDTRRHFEVFCYSPVRGRFAIIFTDITKRKAAEVAFQAQRELLVGIIDNIPVLLCIWDLKTQQFRFNKHMREVLGWTEADATAGDFMAEVYPDPVYRQQVIEYMVSLNGGWRDFKSMAKDGTQIDISWANVRLSDGTSIGIGIDIRERIQREQALREAEEQLRRHTECLEQAVQERTARLRETIADLEQFSYSLAHDLRAPLRSMNSFSTLLLEELHSTLRGESLDYLKRIASGARRMDQLISDVLTYTKVARLEVTCARVDLDRLVRDIIEQYPHLQPQQADIEVSSPLMPVCGNVALVTQCISNLLGNAVKFVASGAKPKIRVWTEPKPGRVRVYVQDNGIGIESHQLEKIWRMFERAHPEKDYPGTGIGLSVVKRAAERMGGSVGVESTLGSGSTFWFELVAPA